MSPPAALISHPPYSATLQSPDHAPNHPSQEALRDSVGRNALRIEPTSCVGVVPPAFFFERIRKVAGATAPSFALLVVDIDGFDAFNQDRGFVAGDQLLDAVGHRFAMRLHGEDCVTRIGGDEFAVLLAGVTDPSGAAAIARHLLAALRHPFEFDSGPHIAKARIGVALCRESRCDLRALLHASRAAVRRAKENGISVAIVQSGDHDAFARRTAAASISGGTQDVLAGREMRDGLLRGEFKVHYQPIHNFATNQVDTLEALVRWQHPTRGLLGPDQFLPAADRAGVARAIGVRVLDCACANLSHWRAHGQAQMRVAVNLSAQDFRGEGIADTITSTLERHALPPSSLELELTEHELLDDDHALSQAAELARHGVALSIDDFGTRYASLRYLHRLPVRALKVDRSFVHDVGRSNASTSIVSAVVGIAGEMGLRLIAEGVEEVRQMKELRRLGCHIMQGYLFSPAVPADDVTGYLARTAPAF